MLRVRARLLNVATPANGHVPRPDRPPTTQRRRPHGRPRGRPRGHRCLVPGGRVHDPEPAARHTVSAMASRKGEFGEPVVLDVDGFDVRVSSPDRVYFPARGETKLDLVDYYLSVGDGIVNALRERPCMLHRFPDGRRRATRCTRSGCRAGAPPWVETVRLHFPRYGLHADELCVTELADVDLGGADVARSSSTRGTAAGPTPRSPTSGASTSTRCRTAPFATRAAGGRTSPTRCSTSSAPSAGRRPAAARACTSTCGSRPTTASRTYAGRRWRSPARSSAACPTT